MSKEVKRKYRKGTCQNCGKQNVTNVFVNGDDLYPSMWLCHKCAEKECGIKPPEKKMTATIGEILKAKGIKL